MTPHHKQKAWRNASPLEGPEGIETVYPTCRMFLDTEQRDQIVNSSKAEEIPDILEGLIGKGGMPAFLPRCN